MQHCKDTVAFIYLILNYLSVFWTGRDGILPVNLIIITSFIYTCTLYTRRFLYYTKLRHDTMIWSVVLLTICLYLYVAFVDNIPVWMCSWVHFQYQALLFRNRDSHYKDKTVVRLSYLYNGNSYTGKIASLYWDGHLDITTVLLLCKVWIWLLSCFYSNLHAMLM